MSIQFNLSDRVCIDQAQWFTKLTSAWMNNTKMKGELPELLAMSTSILIVIILQYSAVAAGNLYFLSERLDGKIKTPPDSNTQVAVSLLQCSALASQQNLPGISYNTVSQACYMYLTCLQVSDGSLIQENGWRHYCTDSVPEGMIISYLKLINNMNVLNIIMTLNITITDFLVNLKNGIVHLLPFMFKKKE